MEDFKNCFVAVLIVLIAIVGVIAVEGLIFWGAGAFIVWAFGLGITWSFWHGVGMAIVAIILNRIFNGGKE